jgi:antitoxin FitA
MVENMSKMIQVRNVSDEVHRTLKTRAAAAGMSLSDYIKRDLEVSAARPTIEEIDARVTAGGPSGLSSEFIISTLRQRRERLRAVLDASVVVEYLTGGEYARQARTRILADRGRPWAPHLLDAEVG